MLSRREYLRALGGALTAASTGRPAPRKPNFLVILADDMGFSDAGCYGGEIDTPNIDALAAGGLRFTQGYSTARCGPSRSCLLTGYYAQQTAADVMTRGNIPAWTRFLPQLLKPLGYRSYHSGKWHIRFRPLTGAGFDRSYTLLDLNRYFTPTAHLLDEERLPPVKPGEGYYATTAIADWAVKFLQEHAARHSDKPFFLYLAFTAPHFPLQALKEDIERYRDRFAEGWDAVRERRHSRLRKMGIVNCGLAPLEPNVWPSWNLSEAELHARVGPGEVARAVPWSSLSEEQKRLQRTKMAIYAAMITRMDQEIGRVIGQLKAMGAFRDTVIFFLSDNGASAELIIRADGHDPRAEPGSARTHLCLGPGWSTASNTPFRLHKSWVHEGGIASPWIVHWPAGIRDAGALRHDCCHFIDVPVTLLELAGGDPNRPPAEGAPRFSGISIASAFARDGILRREFLYFNHNNNRALRVGDWKLVAAGADGPWELYDLARDRAEQDNLIARFPERAEKLAARWKQLDEEFARQRETSPPASSELLMKAGA